MNAKITTVSNAFVLAIASLVCLMPRGSAEEELSIEEQCARLDKTVWAKEELAQKYEQTIVAFWDDMLAAVRDKKDNYDVVKALPFNEIQISSPGAVTEYKWGIKGTNWNGPKTRYSTEKWRELLDQLKTQGFKIVHTEWHQIKFEPDVRGAAHSWFNFQIDMEKPDAQTRYLCTGQVEIEWGAEKDRNDRFPMKNLDLVSFNVLERKGTPAFKEGLTMTAKALGRKEGPDPVICYDLNNDGLPEIILPSWNIIFWNRGGFKLEREELFKTPGEFNIAGAIVADFDGDGLPDIIVAPYKSFLEFHKGLPDGHFEQKAEKILATGEPCEEAGCLSAGDIDGSGHLSLFVGQYKWPYRFKTLPTPYYDANDGWPSYLLKNDGKGHFTDITKQAGLDKKQFRRIFSASFADINGQGHADLLTIADYCGIDLYHNDGKGNFTDVTNAMIPDTKLFGMSHTFGDYNKDGVLDFYAIGMSSTTARRLEGMKLGREDLPTHNAMRMRMGYGNRMYLGNPGGKMLVPPFQDSVTKTGWSWGTTTFDFDNDGEQDIFVANGFVSGKSSRDHCTTFWRHDVYVQTPAENPRFEKFVKTRANYYGDYKYSWNGYEHKKLLMNLGGKDFINVAFLMGCGFEFDGRAVVSADIMGRGKMDLIVTEWAENDFLIHYIVNQFDQPNNWIGVRLKEEGGGVSPILAKITVVSPKAGKQVAQIVTGDSFRTQHGNMKHFGLGADTKVDYIEVTWSNGRKAKIENPEINKYLYIKP